jgi:hypothetical protein
LVFARSKRVVKNEPTASIEKSDTQKSDPTRPSGDMALSVDLGRSLKAFQAARHGKRLKKDFEQLDRWFEIALNTWDAASRCSTPSSI